MTSNPTDTREQITAILARAWPCYIHYADPADLVSDQSDEQIARLLTRLQSTTPTSESPLPEELPREDWLTEEIVRGHEHNQGCLALATAITRCIPALAQTVKEGRCPKLENAPEHEVRSTLASLHAHHHCLDPSGSDDTPLIEALCTRQDRPPEVGPDWRYMVRLYTENVVAGQTGAFTFLPMRCFTDLAHARNWAVMQAAWDCHLFEDDLDLYENA